MSRFSGSTSSSNDDAAQVDPTAPDAPVIENTGDEAISETGPAVDESGAPIDPQPPVVEDTQGTDQAPGDTPEGSTETTGAEEGQTNPYTGQETGEDGTLQTGDGDAVAQAELEGVAAQDAIKEAQEGAEKVSEPDDVIVVTGASNVGSTARTEGDYTDGEYTANKVIRASDMIEGRRSETAWNVSVALGVSPNTDEWGVEILDALHKLQDEQGARRTNFVTRDQARRLDLAFLD